MTEYCVMCYEPIDGKPVRIGDDGPLCKGCAAAEEAEEQDDNLD